MMEQITAAVRSVCIMSAGIYLVSSLIGGTKVRPQAETLIKLVFLFFTAVSAISCVKDFELPETVMSDKRDYSAYTGVYDKELVRKTSENISEVLRSQLEAEGIDVEKINTEVNISENGSISISRIVIGTSDNEAASAVIRRSLGDATEVVYGDM